MPSHSSLPDFLPGQLTLERGWPCDYPALEQFHYLPKRPATWAGVWVVRYSEEKIRNPNIEIPNPFKAQMPESQNPGLDQSNLDHSNLLRISNCDLRVSAPARIVAIGVLSYPMPCCKARERLFELQSRTRREKLKFINQNLRTISRVIVHPQFRSLGLASILVRCLCENCPTRYIEALAIMGRSHPFFETAGMTRIDPDWRDEPLYFIFDRDALSPLPRTRGRGLG